MEEEAFVRSLSAQPSWCTPRRHSYPVPHAPPSPRPTAALPPADHARARPMADDVADQLCSAAVTGSIAGIHAALRAGADPNAYAGTSAWTPLHCAAQHRQVHAISALVHAGAHVDVADNAGATPLMMATMFGLTDIVHILLASGADPNSRQVNALGAQLYLRPRPPCSVLPRHLQPPVSLSPGEWCDRVAPGITIWPPARRWRASGGWCQHGRAG
jgi:hypothetical protein